MAPNASYRTAAAAKPLPFVFRASRLGAPRKAIPGSASVTSLNRSILLRTCLLVFQVPLGCSDSNRSETTYPKAEGPAVGHWENVSNESLTETGLVYASAMAVTDSEYLTWSGAGLGSATICIDGACQIGFALNLNTKKWRAISTDGAPQPRMFPFAVWTGLEVLIWGGRPSLGSSGLSNGGAYDPKTDKWRTLSNEGAPSPRQGVHPIWSGKEWIFWGGIDFSTTNEKVPVLGDGAAYDPVNDRWRKITLEGAPKARGAHAAVWTGTEMLVWGGTTDGSLGKAEGDMLADGFAYDPTADSWREISTVNGPKRNIAHEQVWTGTEMLLWGGFARAIMSAYNPTSDTWRTINPRGPHLEYGSCSAWTGKYFVKCGAQDEPNGGAIYDPLIDTWYPMPAYPIPELSQVRGFAFQNDMLTAGGLSHYMGGYERNVFRYVPPEN